MKLVRTMGLVLAIACASTSVFAQPDKQAPAEVTPNEARSWLALFEKVVDAVVTNREDCAKMSTGLNAVIDSNQETIAMARDAKAKGKRLPAAVQQQMVDGMHKMVASLDKCARDEKVGAAFRRLDLGGHK
jgi:hypothetical protein